MPRSPECVTTRLPRDQWELCARGLLAQGLHHLDARTVPLQLQVSGAVMVRAPLRPSSFGTCHHRRSDHPREDA